MEKSPISKLQEFLQAKAPTLGSRPEELLEYTKLTEEPPFQVRVSLLSTQPSYTGIRQFTSDFRSTVQEAKEDAAQKALEKLEHQEINPHDPKTKPASLYTKGSARNVGGQRGQPMELLDLSPHLFDTHAVFLDAVVPSRGTDSTGEKTASNSTAQEFALKPPLQNKVDTEHDAGNLGMSVPENLGRLGERWLCQWLRLKGNATNVVWKNENSEAGLPFDITCNFEGNGECLIEVKTCWGNIRRAQASEKQLDLMASNPNKFFVCIIGKFENYFQGTCPEIRFYGLKTQQPPYQCPPRVFMYNYISIQQIKDVVGDQGSLQSEVSKMVQEKYPTSVWRKPLHILLKEKAWARDFISAGIGQLATIRKTGWVPGASACLI